MEDLQQDLQERSLKNVVQDLQVHLRRKKENMGIIIITTTRTKLGIDRARETETYITSA